MILLIPHIHKPKGLHIKELSSLSGPPLKVRRDCRWALRTVSEISVSNKGRPAGGARPSHDASLRLFYGARGGPYAARAVAGGPTSYLCANIDRARARGAGVVLVGGVC